MRTSMKLITMLGGSARPTNTVAPAISVTAIVGTQINGDDGTWSGNPTFIYQWQRNTGSWVNIGGATNKNYTPVDADFGYALRLVVTPSSGSAANSNATNLTYVNAFTQSVGAELVTNGTFAAWTTDNPNSWTVSNEAGTSQVHQVGTGEDHTGSGSGCANLYRSDTNGLTISQAILTSNQIYEASVLVDKFTSGQVRMRDNSAKLQYIISSAGQKTTIAPVGGSTFELACISNPTDATLDNASVKLVTPNTVVARGADGTYTFNFTLPASPVAGQRVELRYRVNTSTPKVDYWTLYLVRNDANTNWDVRLDSVVSGTATNRINVTGVGTTIDSLRVTVAGDLHDCFTGVSGTYTQRGSQVNNSAMNTNPGAYALYSTGTIPASLIYQ